jgi:hypothetical protein
MTVDAQITEWLAKKSSQYIHELATKFREQHIVVIDDLLPPSVVEGMRKEARALLETKSQRREVTIKESGNTPRAYSSIGRDELLCSSSFVPEIFHNEALRECLSQIADEPLAKVPYEPEEFILNSQSAPGDTHGWHWDDYAYAFVLVLEAPDPLLGGRVEYIPRLEWKRDDTEAYLRQVLTSKPVRSIHVDAGQCYFAKSNTTLHRVAPLTGATTRTVVVLTYASPEDMVSESITHTSMEEIYPEASAASAHLSVS